LVRGLEEGLRDTIEFLDVGVPVQSAASLFDSVVVVVPSVGVREWLVERLATRLGASGSRDGVVANVDFRFPAALDHFMPGRPEDDPWTPSAMTAALLTLCDTDPWRRRLSSKVAAVGGPLRFASRLADRFDRYHARRPAMIRRWELGAWSLAPEESGVTADGDELAAELSEHDRWQFEVWRDLRAVINVPSLPARLAGELASPSAEVRSSLPPRLLIFGFSSLGQHQVEVVTAIARFSELKVILVHPSPMLAARWAGAPVARTGDALPRRSVEAVPDDLARTVLPMVYGWLRTSRESQQLLARAGIPVVPHRNVDSVLAPATVLEALQRATSDGAVTKPLTQPSDQSVTLHRCHGPARQAEVAFDAIVQALQDDPSLQLHDVAIVSPDIQRMEPYLRATFDRSYRDSQGRVCLVPLSVADRSLQRVDEGARVFVAMLAVACGRLDSTSVQALLGDPALLDSNGVVEPEVWWQWIAAADQRWGADAQHRVRHGVTIVRADDSAEQRHTWLHTLRRVIIGALAGTGREPHVARIVPLPDVEVDELPEVLRLASLVGAVISLVESTTELRTPVEWATIIEDAFVRLCGPDSPLLPSPLSTLRELAALGDTVGVPFADAAGFLSTRCDGVPDSRFNRYGGIVATSMASVRLVPYRVVCIVGFDDEALSTGEAEGDDLVSRQHLLGDPDPRLEHRRALLDAVVSATDRLVICCNGRSLKNNDLVPLPTPLAELLDACRAVGAAPSGASDGPLALDVEHPRHSLSARNFRVGGVVAGRTWSHAADARDIASRIATASGRDATLTWQPIETQGVVRATVDELVTALMSPLSTFLERALSISKFDRDDGPEVQDVGDIPLHIDETSWALAARARYLAVGRDEGSEWREALEASESLPVTAGAAARAVSAIEHAAATFNDAFPRDAWTEVEEQRAVEVRCADGSVVEATIPPIISIHEDLVLREGRQWRHVLAEGSRWLFDPKFRVAPLSEWQTSRLCVGLIAAVAAGIDVKGILVPAPHTGRGGSILLHRVALASPISPEIAREWTSVLVGLRRRAASTPIPNFGGLAEQWAQCAAADPPNEELRDELRRQIAEYETPERGHVLGRDEELLIFGPEANVETLVPGIAIMNEYWSLRNRWWRKPSRSGNGMGKVPNRPFVLVELHCSEDIKERT